MPDSERGSGNGARGPGLFPVFRPPSAHAAGLKVSTQHLLATHRLRPRGTVESLGEESPVLEAYLPHAHGIDALLAIWYAAVQAGEHRRVFGQFGQSPSLFVTTASQTELVVLSRPGAAWRSGEGLLGIASVDDAVEGGRGRVHHYTLPVYRQPWLTRHLATLVLNHLFTTRGYQFVYGLTPVANRAALRFALRLGFTRNGVWPKAIWYDGQIVDAIHTSLTKMEWDSRHVAWWQQRNGQSTEYPA